MVGGGGKVWNPSRSSEIAYAESFSTSFVMPFRNSYFTMIYESMLSVSQDGFLSLLIGRSRNFLKI